MLGSIMIVPCAVANPVPGDGPEIAKADNALVVRTSKAVVAPSVRDNEKKERQEDVEYQRVLGLIESARRHDDGISPRFSLKITDPAFALKVALLTARKDAQIAIRDTKPAYIQKSVNALRNINFLYEQIKVKYKYRVEQKYPVCIQESFPDYVQEQSLGKFKKHIDDAIAQTRAFMEAAGNYINKTIIEDTANYSRRYRGIPDEPSDESSELKVLAAQ